MNAPWDPPDDWLRLTTIDAHTAGEPFRVITGGFPEPRGATVLERRRDARERLAVAELDAEVEVPGFGTVRYDLAYGGAFYAYVEASSLELECRPEQVDDLIAAGRAIKRAVIESRPVVHPFEQDLPFLYGVIFTAAAGEPGHHSRNVCALTRARRSQSARRSPMAYRALAVRMKIWPSEIAGELSV